MPDTSNACFIYNWVIHDLPRHLRENSKVDMASS